MIKVNRRKDCVKYKVNKVGTRGANFQNALMRHDVWCGIGIKITTANRMVDHVLAMLETQ